MRFFNHINSFVFLSTILSAHFYRGFSLCRPYLTHARIVAHKSKINKNLVVNYGHHLNRVKSNLYASTSTSNAKTQNFQSFLKEIVDILGSTGFNVTISRSLQVLKAISIIGNEFASNPSLFMDSKSNKFSPPKLLRRIFEELGATYVKLGQFIASSPTLFPREYVLEFQSCLDKAPTIPFYEIKNIIQKELKKSSLSISEVFSYIDPKPLACASIAQVHKAILKDSGREVVLKVRKPGVDATLKADLGFLYITVKLIEFINPELSRVSMADIVGDIRQSMLDELDFRKELKQLMNFRAFLDRSGIVNAMAPEPIAVLTSERLLVMEFLKGVPLVDLEGIKKYSANPELTLMTALQTWGASVIGAEEFHADVHGGNLLVLEDGRVAFIDFGIVGKISDKVWKALQSLIESFAKGEYGGVAQSLVAMGATDAEVNIDQFSRDIEEVFERIINLQPTLSLERDASGASLEARIEVDERETTELVIQLVEVADKNGLKLPREFGLLLKQALYFDRYQKLLAPNMDPLRDGKVRDALSNSSFSPERRPASRQTVDTEIVG